MCITKNGCFWNIKKNPNKPHLDNFCRKKDGTYLTENIIILHLELGFKWNFWIFRRDMKYE